MVATRSKNRLMPEGDTDWARLEIWICDVLLVSMVMGNSWKLIIKNAKLKINFQAINEPGEMHLGAPRRIKIELAQAGTPVPPGIFSWQ
jgi:hypothetical protein